MYPDYTQMVLQPLLSGLQDSVNELYILIGDMIPIMFPVVGALALISITVYIFKGVINEAITEHQAYSNYADNMDFVDSYLGYDLEDLQNDYFLFDDYIDYDSFDEVGEWIDTSWGDDDDLIHFESSDFVDVGEYEPDYYAEHFIDE